MKPLKYTVAALALVAAASFTQSAVADQPTGTNNGDIILGLYDASGTSTTSYEVDLGAFSTLTAGETFNLGSSISSTYAGDSAAQLEYNIAGAGSTGAGGLAADEIAFTAVSLPTVPATKTTPNNALVNLLNTFASANTTLVSSGTSSSGVTFQIGTVSNGTTFSFGNNDEVNSSSGAVYGMTGGQLLDAYPATDLLSFYTSVNHSSTATLDGSFQFSTNGSGQEILTFDPTATPEPSAYALGLCAVALFWVLKRRRSVA